MENSMSLKSHKGFSPTTQLTPITLVENIVDLFHQSLIDGTLHPGEEIIESQIALDLGVARGTLREAIHTLISEGILEKTSRRRTRVRELSTQKTWEIMTARAVLESYCAHILAGNLTPEKVQALETSWQEMEAAALSGNQAVFTQCDFRLHQTIVTLSGHELFTELWSHLEPWIRLMFASEVFSGEDLIRNCQKHRQIVDAILTGDPGEAENRLRADLLDQGELRWMADLSSYPT
jgi:DNA-binding GntR family transcriptional regulator